MAGIILSRGTAYKTIGQYATLAHAVSDIGSVNSTTLLINEDIIVAVNTTVSSNITLTFSADSIITVNSNITLTINGPLVAADYQIFNNNGSITFGSSSVSFIKPQWFGNLGTANDAPILQAAITTAGNTHAVVISPGSYTITSPLTLGTGAVLMGETNSSRWRAPSYQTKLIWAESSGSAISVVSDTGYDSIVLKSITIDCENATGSAKCLTLDGSSNYIEGVLIEDCYFKDAPSYQVLMSGTVFDVTFRRCTAINENAAAAADLIFADLTPGISPMINFWDCWLRQEQSGSWCYKGPGGNFFGGFIVPAQNGNGIWAVGSNLNITQTHLEGVNETGIGIRIQAASQASINPAECSHWATGLQIGVVGDSNQVKGVTVVGGITPGNGTYDIHITSGGVRYVQLLGSISGAVVQNDRAASDGVATDVSVLGRGYSITGAVIYGGDTGYLVGTATWNPGTISTGASASTTITVPQAAIGDMVTVNSDEAFADGTYFHATVTSSNTVTVKLMNLSGGDYTPGSIDLIVHVYKDYANL